MIRACACGAKFFASLEYVRSAGNGIAIDAERSGKEKEKQHADRVTAAACAAPVRLFACSTMKKPPFSGGFFMVEMIRLELTTYTLRTYRSTG